MTDYRHIPTSLLPVFYREIKRNVEAGVKTMMDLKKIENEAKKRGVYLGKF
ncbi:hypothetical protein [Halalkalibacter wakoensis]|nr:hypothetical protein [Halalkalibacter wakoensis]